MANTDVNVKLTVSDGGGTAKLNKEAAQYRANMEAGASAPSRAPSGPRMSAAYKSTENAMGRGETKTSRSIGAGAGTGSAASDFAAQASGLGGLVHVYATFAANIFALSAAFSALSKAMDTSNMIKGLDQLGAASGRSLGTLAKQMTLVADGAISMQQAISSTALASSGGMSAQSILRMTEIAKKASLALGRDMADSMDRLTKGIVKTQPELLDELGIMTRMIPAQQAYARQVGKSIDALTEFEKKQAFANAVLEEGEKKFGAIKIDSNPYSKILASMQNIAQTGLSLVNTVLSPIVSILSSSPTALATAMGLLGSVLLKQALPAIGSFKDSLKKAADDATMLANKRSIEARNLATRELTEVRKLAESKADAEIVASEKALNKLNALRSASKIGKDTKAYEIMQKIPTEVTNEDLDHLTKQAALLRKKNNIIAAEGYDELSKSLRASRDLEIEAAKAIDIQTAALMKQHSLRTTAGQFQKIVDKENQAAISRNIVSQAAETAGTLGLSAAWKDAKASIEEARKASTKTVMMPTGEVDKFGKSIETAVNVTVPGINKMQAGWTMLKVGIAGATAAAATFINAFGVWAVVATVVISAVQGIYNWISKSRDSMERYEQSIDNIKDAVKNAENTIDTINAKGILANITIESIQARANAFDALSQAVTASIAAFNKLEKEKNGLERFVDGIYAIFGKSDQEVLTKNISNSLSKSFDLISDSSIKGKFQKSINAVFNSSTDIDVSKLDKALYGLTDKQKLDKLDQLSKIFKNMDTEINNTASTLTKFDADLKKLSDETASAINKLMPTDEYSKVGLALYEVYKDMSNTVVSSLESVQALQDSINKNPILGVFNKKAVEDIVGATEKLKNLQLLKERFIKEEDARRNPGRSSEQAVKDSFSSQTIAAKGQQVLLKTARVDIPTATYSHEGLKEINRQITETSNTAIAMHKGFLESTKEAAIRYLKDSLSKVQAEAAINLQKTKLSIRESYGDRVGKEERSLIEKQYALKIKEVEFQYEMYGAQKDNTEALLELTDTIKLQMSGNASTTPSGESVESIKASMQSRREAKAKALTEGSDKNSPQNIAKQAKISELLGQKAVDLENNKNKIAKETYSLETDRLALQAASIESRIKENTFLQESSVYYNQQLASEGEQLAIEAINNSYAKKYADIREKVNNTEDIATLGILGKQEEQLVIDKKRETSQLILNNAYNSAIKQSDQKLNIEKQLLDTKNAYVSILNSEDNVTRSTLSALKELGGITEESYLSSIKELDVVKLKRKEEEDLANLKSQYNSALEKNTAEKNRAGPGADTSGIEAERTRIEENYKARSAAITAETSAQQKILDINFQVSSLHAKQNEQMQNMVGITESLTTLFGEMGTNIGKAGEALLKMGQNEETLAKAKQAALAELAKNGPPDPAETAKIEEKFAKQSAISQLGSITTVAGAAKKAFNEKSKEYKALETLEKVSSGVRLAIQLKETALKIHSWMTETAAKGTAEAAQTSLTIGGAMSRVGAYIADIYGKTIGQLGPIAGPAVATALVAAMLAQLGGSGGGGIDMTGKTAKERQDLGSGQKYDENGNIVSTGGGVFGDVTAKSKSIENSLELIAATSVEGMSYYNKMVDLLTGIKEGITGVSTNLYSVMGLGQKSAFGTQEGSGGSPGFLGMFASSSSTEITDAGLTFKGKFTDLVNNTFGTVKQYEDVLNKSSSSGIFGFFSSSNESLTNNVKNLDKGLLTQISLIFKDANELFVTLGAKVGLTATQVFDKLSTIDIDKLASLKDLKGEELRTALSSVFSSIFDDAAIGLFANMQKFRKAGEGMLETVVRVLDTNEKIKSSFASIGKEFISPKDITIKPTKEKLDRVDATKARLASLSTETYAFYDSLEGISYRVGASAADISAAQAEYDAALSDAAETTTTYAYDITEALAKAAGGLDKFLSATKEFGDNYLTEAQRLKFRGTSATTEATRLINSDSAVATALQGITTPGSISSATKLTEKDVDLSKLTRSALRDLILGYKVVDDATAHTYTELLNFANGMDYIFDASEKAQLAIEDMQAKVNSYSATSTDAAIKYERDKVRLANVDNSALQVLQEQAWAAEDAAKLRKKETDLMSAQGLTAQALARSREDELKTMTSAEQAIQKEIWAAQDKAKLVSMAVSLLDLEGRTYEATQAKRAKALAGMTADEASIQSQIDAQEDKNKTDSLTLKIAGLQGRSTEVLAATRNKELKALSKSDQALQKQIYVLEDIASFADKAGIGVSGLTRIFMDQLNSTTAGADATEAGKYVGDMVVYGIKKTMYENALTVIMTTMYNTVISPIINGILVGTIVFDDFGNMTDTVTGKVTSLSTVLEAIGNDAETMADRLDKATPWLNKVVTTVANSTATMFTNFASGFKDFVGNMPEPPKVPDAKSSKDLLATEEEKTQKNLELDIALLRAQRLEHEAVEKERENVNNELLKKYGEEFLIKQKLIDQAIDDAKTYDLNTSLLEAEGKILEATNRKRDIERLALSKTDKAIQERIWKLEDEKAALEKKNSYESQIYDLLGKKSGSLAIARKAELDAMDQQYRPMQEYIYALEDEVDLRGKISDAIYSNIDNMKGFVKSLRDYKKELMVGNLSTKTPLQKYEAAKTEFERLLAIAKGPAKTNAEIAARDEAVGKLQGASSTFLELSQTMFASSEAYQKDFSTVSSALDDTANSLETQISTDIKQLDELGLIKEATRDTKDLIDELLKFMEKTETARGAAEKAGSTAAATGISTIAAGKYVDEAYKTILNRTPDTAGREFWTSALKSGTSVDQMIAAIKSSPEGSVQGLYQSTFGRYADQGGLDFWMKQLSSGSSIADIAATMKSSPEGIIQSLYKSELGRTADKAGLDYWIGQLNSGMSVDSIKAAIDSSDEYRKIKGFAEGGFHSGGLRIVGENGPELEATGPSRVWNANQLSNVLSNKELINEIKALRQEVAQLRQEQQEQTGHLIQTNYDANMRAAGIVADATDEAANAATWNQRNQVAIK